MKGSKLYVGNVGYSATNQELKELFSEHGEVREVNVIEGKGFGFVEMSVDDEARAAIEALNNTELKGRNMNVNEARPRAEGSRGGGDRGRSW